MRCTREGWLEGERVGRRSRMRLTPSSAELLRDGARRIYGFGGPVSWDGRWLLLVLRVPEQRRELRHRLTTQLAWAGFGSLGGGLWITPHVDREALVQAEEPAQLLSFRAELGALGGTREGDRRGLGPARRCASTTSSSSTDFARARPRGGAATFAAQTALVHAWRRFPFIDPDLPDDLLPARLAAPARATSSSASATSAGRPPAQEHFDALAAMSGRKRIYVAYVGGTIGMQADRHRLRAGPRPPDRADPRTARSSTRARCRSWSIPEYEPLLDSANARPADWLRIAARHRRAPPRTTTASSSCTARTRWPTRPRRSPSCCAGSASRSSSRARRSRSACCAATGARTC